MTRIITLVAMSLVMQIAHAQERAKPKPKAEAELSAVTPATAKIKFEAEAPLEATAAIPVFKFRQGEKFKIFDGIGGGLKYTPVFGDANKNASVSWLVMLSSNTITDKTTNTSDTVNIMSTGLVFGYSWFQIGVGRDLISSSHRVPLMSARSGSSC